MEWIWTLDARWRVGLLRAAEGVCRGVQTLKLGKYSTKLSSRYNCDEDGESTGRKRHSSEKQSTENSKLGCKEQVS